MANLNPDSGWVLKGNSLFRTNNNGKIWSDITPVSVGNERIEKVFFLDSSTGWILKTRTKRINETEIPSILISRTTDGGHSWTQAAVASKDPEVAGEFSGQAQFAFIDRKQGWVALSMWSSPLFRYGILFVTSDGGKTWTRRSSLPSGGLTIVSSDAGYLAGGPDEELYKTADRGNTWSKIPLPSAPIDIPKTWLNMISAPKFVDAMHGVLVVSHESPTGTNSIAVTYRTADGGASWKFANTKRISGRVTTTLLSITQVPIGVSLHNDVLSVYIVGQNVSTKSAKVLLPPVSPASKIPPSGSPPPFTSVSGVSFSSTASGWVLLKTEYCTAQGVVCETTYGLLSTDTGGRHFENVILPPRGASWKSR